MTKFWSLIVGSLLAFGLSLVAGTPAQAQEVNRYYHYPFYYFPHSYYPNYVNWPDPRMKFQRPPAYMAYPPYRDPNWRYDLYETKRYYRGFHFFLDQF